MWAQEDVAVDQAFAELLVDIVASPALVASTAAPGGPGGVVQLAASRRQDPLQRLHSLCCGS